MAELHAVTDKLVREAERQISLASEQPVTVVRETFDPSKRPTTCKTQARTVTFREDYLTSLRDKTAMIVISASVSTGGVESAFFRTEEHVNNSSDLKTAYATAFSNTTADILRWLRAHP